MCDKEFHDQHFGIRIFSEQASGRFSKFQDKRASHLMGIGYRVRSGESNVVMRAHLFRFVSLMQVLCLWWIDGLGYCSKRWHSRYVHTTSMLFYRLIGKYATPFTGPHCTQQWKPYWDLMQNARNGSRIESTIQRYASNARDMHFGYCLDQRKYIDNINILRDWLKLN